jgi:hypothetical protein
VSIVCHIVWSEQYCYSHVIKLQEYVKLPLCIFTDDNWCVWCKKKFFGFISCIWKKNWIINANVFLNCIHRWCMLLYQSYRHTYVIHIHTYIHTYIYTCIHTHTHTHRYIYTLMHTNVHSMDPVVCHKGNRCETRHKYTNVHNFYHVKYYKHFTKQYYKSSLCINNSSPSVL